MSPAEQATCLVREMLEIETKGWGDDGNALDRLGIRYRVSRWTLHRLFKGRAKTVDAGLLNTIRAAYLDVLERQVRRCLLKIEQEKALGTDDYIESLAADAADLVGRLQAKKGTLK